jgi:Tol biopolymer transport system component
MRSFDNKRAFLQKALVESGSPKQFVCSSCSRYTRLMEDPPVNLESSESGRDAPKNSRKKLLLIVAAVVLVGAFFAVAAFVVHHKKANQTFVAQPGNTTQTKTQTKVQPTPVYYFVSNATNNNRAKGSFNYTFSFVSPLSQQTTTKLLNTPWSFSVESLKDSRNSLSFSADGKQFAYSVSDHGEADDPYKPQPNSYELVVGDWGKAQRVAVKDREPGGIVDWVLTADGKEVFYIDQVHNNTGEVMSTTLYSVDVATAQTTKIGSFTLPADREHSDLKEVTKDKSVRMYVSMDDGIYENRYDRTSKQLTYKKVAGKNYESGNMGQLSPDGTRLLYIGNNSGTAHELLYLIDLTKGTVQTLRDDTTGFTNPIWSPDSSQLLFSTAPYGAAQQEQEAFDNKLFIYTLASKTQKVLQENSSTGGYAANSSAVYGPNSWSPDGRFITYTQNQKIYVYDLKQAKVLDKLTFDTRNSSDAAYTFGWITQ